MNFVPHSEKQERAIFSEAKIMLAGSGIQWGKTRVGAVRMKIAMHEFADPGNGIETADSFIVAAPNYKTLQQSTLPAFLGIMEGCGTYNESKAVFKTHWGTYCYFRTATDPDSVVGITNVRHVWGDEAGKFGLYFWENLQARASFKDCPITLTTSPYALNWIYKEIIRPKMKDPNARPDVEWIYATSAENPFFPIAEYERKRLTMESRRFNAIYGGRWEKMAGLVYDVFDDVENTCAPFSFPTGTKFVGGIDWGWSNPFALVVRAITPDDAHYQCFEFYRSGCTLAQKIEVAKQAKALFGVKPFYADPSNPEAIAAFNEAGLTCVPADNAIQAGIDDHYEMIKTRRYKVIRGTSPYTLDEYESYHWPEEIETGPDKDIKEQTPVKQNEHAMDANRYVTRMTRRGVAKKVPTVAEERQAQEDQYRRIERLKRKSRIGSESWSA